MLVHIYILSPLPHLQSKEKKTPLRILSASDSIESFHRITIVCCLAIVVLVVHNFVFVVCRREYHSLLLLLFIIADVGLSELDASMS